VPSNLPDVPEIAHIRCEYLNLQTSSVSIVVRACVPHCDTTIAQSNASKRTQYWGVSVYSR